MSGRRSTREPQEPVRGDHGIASEAGEIPHELALRAIQIGRDTFGPLPLGILGRQAQIDHPEWFNLSDTQVLEILRTPGLPVRRPARLPDYRRLKNDGRTWYPTENIIIFNMDGCWLPTNNASMSLESGSVQLSKPETDFALAAALVLWQLRFWWSLGKIPKTLPPRNQKSYFEPLLESQCELYAALKKFDRLLARRETTGLWQHWDTISGPSSKLGDLGRYRETTQFFARCVKMSLNMLVVESKWYLNQSHVSTRSALERFIRSFLHPAFKSIFGEQRGVSRKVDQSLSGPFIKFGRTFFSAIDYPVSDETIARATSPAGPRKDRGRKGAQGTAPKVRPRGRG